MKKFLFFLLIPFVLTGCPGNPETTNYSHELVIFSDTIPKDSFYNHISHIRIVQPQAGQGIFLEPGSNVHYSNGEIFIQDNSSDKIYRFDQDGILLNSIGGKGRGPGEFIDIQNMQISNDTIVIFSLSGRRVDFFHKDGSHISSKDLATIGFGALKCGNNYILSKGLNSKDAHNNQFVLTDSTGVIMEKFLPAPGNMPVIALGSPFFYDETGEIFLKGTAGYTIYKYNNGKIEPFMEFDMGKYNLPKEFFTQSDPADYVNILESKENAIIARFFQTPRLTVIHTFIMKMPSAFVLNGFKRDGKWMWVRLASKEGDPFADGLCAVFGDRFVFSISPASLGNMSQTERELTINPEIMENLDPEGGMILVEFYFK